MSFNETSFQSNQTMVVTVSPVPSKETCDKVQEMIQSDKVVIFSKTYCPYSNLAKRTFDSLQQKYTAIELNGRDDCEKIQAALGKLTGATTVPRVFIDGNFVGGGTDVRTLYDKGELKEMLSTDKTTDKIEKSLQDIENKNEQADKSSEVAEQKEDSINKTPKHSKKSPTHTKKRPEHSERSEK